MRVSEDYFLHTRIYLHHASLSRVSISIYLPGSPHSTRFLRRTSNASLPSQGFWSKLKPGGGGKNVKDAEMRQQQHQQQQQMALSRQRLLTLVYDEMETVRMVCTCTSSPRLVATD